VKSLYLHIRENQLCQTSPQKKENNKETNEIQNESPMPNAQCPEFQHEGSGQGIQTQFPGLLRDKKTIGILTIYQKS